MNNIIIFLISAQKHRLWVLVRTASPPTIYVLSRKKKYQIFLSANFPFLAVKVSIYFNRRVFVMTQKCHNHEAQPSQGIKRRRNEEQIRTKQTPYNYKTIDKQVKKNCNRGTALKLSVGKPVSPSRNPFSYTDTELNHGIVQQIAI